MKKFFAAFTAILFLSSCTPATPGIQTYTSKVPKTIETPAFGAEASSKTVTISIFSDFECPSCQILHEQLLLKFQKDYVETQKVRVEYKNFPLTQHDNAMGDALAGLYAHSKGKYLEFAEKMFALEVARAGAAVTDSDRSDIIAAIGLDKTEFLTSLSEGWYVNQVEKEVAE